MGEGVSASGNVRIEPATMTELSTITGLLDALALPTDGVADQFPRAFVVAKDAEGVLVGCAGLETYAGSGLLRSVAVRPSMQRSGLGRILVEERLESARRAGLEAVYLLTTTAADYFPRLGFALVDLSAVPAALAASREFVTICPASAKCFARRL